MEKLAVERKKVGVIIGKKGSTKNLLEQECGVRLKISRAGEITILGGALKTYLAFNVLKAISLGFPVDGALQLKNPDYVFETINIKDFAKSKSRMVEIKGRLIGTKGNVKKVIQHLGDIDICVSESQIGIIGKAEDVLVAREAIQALLRGAKHGRIFKWLEHKERFFRKGHRKI